MALGTCAGKETPLLLQAAEPGAGTHLPKCPQQNPAWNRHFRSQQRRNNSLSYFSPTWQGQKRREFFYVRQQGKPHLLQRTKKYSVKTGWLTTFQHVWNAALRKNIGSRDWLMFGISYSHCSVLFLSIVVTDSFSLLIPQERNSVHVRGHYNHQQLHHYSIIWQDK